MDWFGLKISHKWSKQIYMHGCSWVTMLVIFCFLIVTAIGIRFALFFFGDTLFSYHEWTPPVDTLVVVRILWKALCKFQTAINFSVCCFRC